MSCRENTFNSFPSGSYCERIDFYLIKERAIGAEQRLVVAVAALVVVLLLEESIVSSQAETERVFVEEAGAPGATELGLQKR